MLAPGHYEALIAALWQAGFSVAGLHLSGHGKLRDKNNFTFESLLGEGLKAEAWLHANGFGPLVVVGHSQGGIMALAHATISATLLGAFSICAVLPRMESAISLTRFASLACYKEIILSLLRKAASICPGLPIPLPLYLKLSRIMAGRKYPVHMGNAEGRISYPLRYLVSLFDADISIRLLCPFWLCSAKNDALFTTGISEEVFGIIKAPAKKMLWLEEGGHMAPLNPVLAHFIARSIACECAASGMPLVIGNDFFYEGLEHEI